MSWFIGVPLALAGDDRDLLPADGELVVTRAGDRHVTLVFLGQAREGDARAVWDTVPAVVLPSTTRAVAWERFGRSAIALVLSDDDGRLEAAERACHDAAHGVIAVRRPSPYRPHVTLARVPRRARPPTAAALRGWPLPVQALALGPLTLYCSRQGGSADRYEIVDQRREVR